MYILHIIQVKRIWVSIILDNTLSDKKKMELVDLSYDISNIKGEWIVPANPRYYDIINAFKNLLYIH